MRVFEVTAGYYEYNVWLNGEHLITIGDPNEDLAQIRTKSELKDYCKNTIDACIVEELHDTKNIDLDLSKREYNSILKQLMDLYYKNGCDFKYARQFYKKKEEEEDE